MKTMLTKLEQYNYFELVGITPAPSIDLEQLEQNYLLLQNKTHPDRFPDEQQKKSVMLISDRLNKAYHILKDDLSRRIYLLEMHGIFVNGEEDNIKPDFEFLEEIFDRRAEIESITDTKLLDDALLSYDQKYRSTLADHDLFYNKANYNEAGNLLIKAKYYMKIKEEISHKIGKSHAVT